MLICTARLFFKAFFSGIISFDPHESPRRQESILSHFTDKETDFRLSALLKFIPLVSEGPRTRDQTLLTSGPVLFPDQAALLISFSMEVNRPGCLCKKGSHLPWCLHFDTCRTQAASKCLEQEVDGEHPNQSCGQKKSKATLKVRTLFQTVL